MPKAKTKPVQAGSVGFQRPAAEQPDHRHRWLLRLRRHRPSCCAAKKRDELAAPESR
jgi:hypothetical protein